MAFTRKLSKAELLPFEWKKAYQENILYRYLPPIYEEVLRKEYFFWHSLIEPVEFL